MPIRIVVVETDGVGGLAHFAYEMANALAAEGADVTLLTSRHYELRHLSHACRLDASLPMWPNIDPRTSATRRARPLVLLRHYVRRPARGLQLAFVWWTITKRILHDRPDAVQFSTIPYNFVRFFLYKLRSAGLVLTQVCHEFEPRDWGRLRRTLSHVNRRSVYDPFARVFCLGERVREDLLAMTHVTPSRVIVIPHGGSTLLASLDDGRSNLRDRYGLGPDDRVVLFFGGLRPSKGIEDAIAAFSGVVRAVRNARLLIVGHPQSNVRPDAYAEQAAALGLETCVTVDPRYVPNNEIGALIRTSDVVLLPYRNGTASGVLQAAFTFGRPVVVTDAGSVAEPVRASGAGIVVAPGDRQALTSALRNLLLDPDTARVMGAAGHAYALQQHHWGRVAHLVLAATQAAVDEHRATQ
jgi:glycosyltransferase involved in cell wall biosynthesis